MKWLRHRKARSDRWAGLAFAWRTPAARFGSVLAGAVVVGLLAAAMATVVKVRVLMPPARSGQRGTLMLARGGDEMSWLARGGAELTPFPAPLEVHGIEETERALAGHPALGRRGAGEYVPRLREWPAGAEVAVEPAGGGGLVELPPLAPLPEVPRVPEVAGGGIRSRPVLVPDLAGLAARVPVPLPDFELPAGLVPPDDDPRFMIELGADGRVRSVVALEGAGSSPVVVALGRWLRRIRFEPVEGGAGWFAVAVGFVFSGDD